MVPSSRLAELRQLLDAHMPADAAEAGYRADMLALCDGPGDPFDRAHFEPGHFTASAFVLGPDGDDLLLIWHTKLHLWLQPGGHIDPEDADVFAAARREVAEEAGVTTLVAVGDGLFDLDIHVIPARQHEPAHRHFDVRLLYRCQDGALVAGSDAGDARWVGLAAVTPAESDESVLRAVRKLRRMGIR